MSLIKYSLSLIIIILLSCDSTNLSPSEYQLIGEWKLVEQLADPGDGSGEFRPVDRDKRIKFNSDGTVFSNGSLCTFGTADKSESNGSYSAQTNTLEVTCGDKENSLGFEINEDGKMEIWYFCIEGCAERYVNLGPVSF